MELQSLNGISLALTVERYPGRVDEIVLRLPLSTGARARAAALRLQDSPGNVDSLTRIASESGTSLRTLQRAFLRETGLTLEAWRRCTARATGA